MRVCYHLLAGVLLDRCASWQPLPSGAHALLSLTSLSGCSAYELPRGVSWTHSCCENPLPTHHRPPPAHCRSRSGWVISISSSASSCSLISCGPVSLVPRLGTRTDILFALTTPTALCSTDGTSSGLGTVLSRFFFTGLNCTAKLFFLVVGGISAIHSGPPLVCLRDGRLPSASSLSRVLRVSAFGRSGPCGRLSVVADQRKVLRVSLSTAQQVSMVRASSIRRAVLINVGIAESGGVSEQCWVAVRDVMTAGAMPRNQEVALKADSPVTGHVYLV